MDEVKRTLMGTMRQMRKNTHFWEHEYTVTKIDSTPSRNKVVSVTGSRDAAAKQQEFEDAGFCVIVVNKTVKEEEYRTPGSESRISDRRKKNEPKALRRHASHGTRDVLGRKIPARGKGGRFLRASRRNA